MIRRISMFAVPIFALLLLASTAMATPRHKRLKIPPAPPNAKLPPEVLKVLKQEFPTGKVTGSWYEGKCEMEVFVSVPGSHPIEVVFCKKGGNGPWHLEGYEYPVPSASLPPNAMSALCPGGQILEVEMVFNASWTFLGWQVTVRCGSQTEELHILPNGKRSTKDFFQCQCK